MINQIEGNDFLYNMKETILYPIRIVENIMFFQTCPSHLSFECEYFHYPCTISMTFLPVVDNIHMEGKKGETFCHCFLDICSSIHEMKTWYDRD